MAEQFADKTEAPTPRRLNEARERGQVARSQDLSAAVLLFSTMLLVWTFGSGLFDRLVALCRRMFELDVIADQDVSNLVPLLLETLIWIGRGMLPLLAGVIIVAVLASILQTGPLLTPKKLQPKFDSLNPINGVKRLFGGGRNVVQNLFHILKLILISAVVYSSVHGKFGQIITLAQLTHLQAFDLVAGIVLDIGIKIAVVLLVLAIFDFAWQKWRTSQDLKMTKQEVKDEMKNMEGDPMIKQRRRQIQQQRAMQRINAAVPTADVVVTNPTHYAVALKYDGRSMNAPRVVAKGADYLALRIRMLAQENGVPVIQRPPLARAIYRACEVGQEIPEEFYAAVAEILAYVWEITGKTAEKRRQTQAAAV